MMKKWWLEYVLPDGNIWSGWINTYPNKRGIFPTMLKGTFWVSKEPRGWHGYFKLVGQTDDDAVMNGQYVITNNIRRPDLNGNIYNKVTSRQQAESILDYLQPVQYDYIDKFTGSLEQHIVLEKTYVQK